MSNKKMSDFARGFSKGLRFPYYYAKTGWGQLACEKLYGYSGMYGTKEERNTREVKGKVAGAWVSTIAVISLSLYLLNNTVVYFSQIK